MKISACIIAKNEEKNLPRLLKSIKDKFDEIILVDTGSTDKTIDIAKNFSCKVFQKDWKGFADARNFAVSKATGDWIWHFDADFELENSQYQKAVFFLKNIPQSYDAVMIGVKNFDKNGIVTTYSSQIFIHRNKPNIKWVGKVHEYINVDVSYGIPVFVNHYGYQDNEILYKKAQRNLKLLEEEIKTLERDSQEYLFKLFYIVQSYVVFFSTKKSDSTLYKKVEKYINEYLNIKQTFHKGRGITIFDNHIFSYALTVYISQKEFKKAKQMLEHQLIKDSSYPDIVYYRILVENHYKNYKELVEQIINFVEILDKAKKNLFLNGENKVIESANKINQILNLLQEPLSKLDTVTKESFEKKALQIFKATKGENSGLVLYKILKSLKKDHQAKTLLKKLSRLSNDKLSTLRVAVEMVKEGEKEQAKKILQTIHKV
ncbi:MAG: glycosyltransferase family 2 protein [Aquificae bacterium]|nr:glycosyltransferase family 2 protein [Aquificota bacterium]